MNQSSFVKRQIPLLYRKSFFDISILIWVESRRVIGHSISKAIEDFQQHYCIDEDEMSFEYLQQTYHRIKREYYETTKREKVMTECAKTRK